MPPDADGSQAGRVEKPFFAIHRRNLLEVLVGMPVQRSILFGRRFFETMVCTLRRELFDIVTLRNSAKRPRACTTPLAAIRVLLIGQVVGHVTC